MGLISNRGRCFSALGLMNECVIISRGTGESTPAIQEVASHAMILLEEPTAAFNVQQAGLDVPPVCGLPPESPGTSEPRPPRVNTVYRSREIYKLPIKACLTWCNRRGLRSDKGGYKKTHPFWPWGQSPCSGHGGHILRVDWQAALTCSSALLLCLRWKSNVCRHVQ